MKTVRVFVAHAKGDPDDRLAEMKTAVTSALRAVAGDKPVTIEVTLGRDDFERSFAHAGSWDGWARSVGAGVHPVTREPTYHAIVVTAERVGAATAKIVEAALSDGRKVVRIVGEDEGGPGLVPVTAVRRVAQDFKSGWQVY